MFLFVVLARFGGPPTTNVFCRADKHSLVYGHSSYLTHGRRGVSEGSAVLGIQTRPRLRALLQHLTRTTKKPGQTNSRRGKVLWHLPVSPKNHSWIVAIGENSTGPEEICTGVLTVQSFALYAYIAREFEREEGVGSV